MRQTIGNGWTIWHLTGCTLWFTAKRRRSDADDDAIAALYWTGSGHDGITVADVVEGVAFISIPSTDTTAFVQAAHYWDLQLADTASVVRTVDSGVLVVQSGVTARTTTP